MGPLKHIKLMEDAVAYSDPMYGSDTFKIRYRQINDLSNKKSSDLVQKPNNDLLDAFQEGDIVTGKDTQEDVDRTGPIVKLQKDSDGENVEIAVEEDGKIYEIKPSTVRFADQGDRGNVKGAVAHNTMSSDTAEPNFNTFAPFVYEKNKSLRNIKTYSDF